ncbi:DNA-binding transcription factor [Lithospermum erythrorhizon]|uniref:DNA-binding transcription factor n=1 Tax=Lithospermum erythrorhizon TaxID=34254 RepID=A0AAV3P9C1_LITER
MCSKFEGDLADIIRGSSSGGGSGNKMMTSSEELAVDPTWQFPSNPTNYSSEIMEERLDGFGDPFPNMQDPLLQDLDTPISPPTFFTTNNNIITSHISNNENNVTNTIFSRMGYHQITSSVDKLSVAPVVAAASPRLKSTTSILVTPNDLINNCGTSNNEGHVMETQLLQISSPQNTGIKRRKSQAKKVVCIPAPAPVSSSRQGGEVVPSDLWAWRKYGQKPIKGSPYPRGYYRCSSSKGCSARKQVERSRTDPNMLVITYTCEHNHPWPTQRNALAGSTRSSPHTSKNNTSSSSTLQTSPSSSFSHQKPSNNTNTTTNILKEDDEGKKESNSTSISDCPNVKEEDIMDKRVEMETHVPSFSQTYRPTLPDESTYYHHSEDFFAELGEIEADPLNNLFENNRENKQTAALDPFGFYDWTAENNDSGNSITSGLLGGEAKGGVQQNP